jgi:excisionase family DNA binding protein
MVMGKGLVGEARVEPRLPDELREVMTVDQAAQYLGVSPDTLYKYLSEGKVPAFKLGNRWRLKKTTLDRWMERQSQTRDGRTARRASEARPQ